jgi:hypothetical protein
MNRVRVGLFTALAAVALAAGCGSDPAPAPQDNLPPPPTAPVNANGQPITSLCELLTVEDFGEVAGVGANQPEAKNATATSATCDYGANTQMVVNVGTTLDEAMADYQTAVKGASFATVVTEGPVGGVDESLHGIGSDSAGLTLRRQKLVVTIVMPGTPEDGEVKLIQLAGRVLSRVHALGT